MTNQAALLAGRGGGVVDTLSGEKGPEEETKLLLHGGHTPLVCHKNIKVRRDEDSQGGKNRTMRNNVPGLWGRGEKAKLSRANPVKEKSRGVNS